MKKEDENSEEDNVLYLDTLPKFNLRRLQALEKFELGLGDKAEFTWEDMFSYYKSGKGGLNIVAVHQMLEQIGIPDEDFSMASKVSPLLDAYILSVINENSEK